MRFAWFAVLTVGLAGCSESYGPATERVLSFEPPPGSLVSGYRETATHRVPDSSTPTVIRGAVVGGVSKNLDLWLHLDSLGHVVDVKGDTAPPDAVDRARRALLNLRFIPFVKNGRPSEAWVQETIVWASREGLAAPPAWNLPGCVGACGPAKEGSGPQVDLRDAVLAGNVLEARRLIAAAADPSASFSGWWDGGATYLMLAAGSGVWEMVADALARPHDLDARDADGRTALDWVAFNAPATEDIFPLIEQLLRAGASRRGLDSMLRNTCRPRWISGLIALGADPNARDAQGRTALFGGCPRDAVRALLAAGADPAVKDNGGHTAIEAVFTGERDPRAALLRHPPAGRK